MVNLCQHELVVETYYIFRVSVNISWTVQESRILFWIFFLLQHREIGSISFLHCLNSLNVFRKILFWWVRCTELFSFSRCTSKDAKFPTNGAPRLKYYLNFPTVRPLDSFLFGLKNHCLVSESSQKKTSNTLGKFLLEPCLAAIFLVH